MNKITEDTSIDKLIETKGEKAGLNLLVNTLGIKKYFYKNGSRQSLKDLSYKVKKGYKLTILITKANKLPNSNH